MQSEITASVSITPEEVKILFEEIDDNRFAKTHPADPAPIII